MKTEKTKHENATEDRSVLGVIKCPFLQNDIEKHLIINKEPFLYHTNETIKCQEFLLLMDMLPETPIGKTFEYYFHLGDPKKIDFKIDRRRIHEKLTLEDDIYKGVKLTLVYS